MSCSTYLPVIWCAVLGFGLAFFVIPLIIKAASRLGVSRGPDAHHTNQTPICRLGGLALVAAFVGTELFIAALFPEHRTLIHGRTTIVLGSLAMFALGFVDDLRPLGAKKKLAGQVLIALAMHGAGLGIQHLKIPFGGGALDLEGWGVIFTVLWLVGMTNLINLIDGVDGLAGGICLMLMVLLMYVGHASGGFELLTAGMAGGLLAFLYYNFPPARIYLGDGGAYFLGFQIGMFSLVSSQKGTVFAALAAPLFVLALPILDTSLAILRRGLRGLPVFRPDQRHLHHHLLGMGLSRTRVVLSFYAVTLIFLAMGFAAVWSRGQLVPILLGAAALLLVLCAGKLRFSRSWFAIGRTVGDSLGMRREVQCALSLNRWLACESERCASIDELWRCFLFAAQRLGFVSVKLTLADDSRTWEQTGVSSPLRSARYEMQAGLCGVLELKATLCEGTGGQTADSAGLRARPDCRGIADSRLFDLLGELLVEGWLKAVNTWNQDADGTVLRFDRKPARSYAAARGKSLATRSPAQPEAVPAKLGPETMPLLTGKRAES